MELEGVLFRYGSSNCHLAFQTGRHRRHVIFVSGLTEGLLSIPCIALLAKALDAEKWSLVQAQISGSYHGYGTSSLNQDAADLHLLLAYLRQHRECEECVLMGHSTGTQDTVRFLKNFRNAEDVPRISGVVLHAPVSDQELLEMLGCLTDNIDAAVRMRKEGKGEHILMRDYHVGDGSAITANRYLALAQRRGDDDMFSSYLTDAEMQDLFSHMTEIKCLLITSGADEYIPDYVDKEQLTSRLAAAMGPLATFVVVQGSLHDARDHSKEVTNAVVQFIVDL